MNDEMENEIKCKNKVARKVSEPWAFAVYALSVFVSAMICPNDGAWYFDILLVGIVAVVIAFGALIAMELYRTAQEKESPVLKVILATLLLLICFYLGRSMPTPIYMD